MLTTDLFTDERRLGKITAYIATVVFAISLLRFYFIPRLSLSANSVALAVINGWLPIVAHVLLFPVVAALPAPKWAKAAGYGWLMIDITTLH